jgi:integrase
LTTAASVESIMRVHPYLTFGHRQVSSIRTSEIQAWVTGLPLAQEQVRAMIEAVGDRYRALIVLLVGSGVRPGEALGLTKDRV